MKYWLILLLLLLIDKAAAQTQPASISLNPHKRLFADTLYQEGVATGDSLKIAEAYYIYGKSYALAGHFLTAKSYFLKSLQIQEKRGDSYEHGRLYLRLAELEVEQSHDVDALRYLQQALSIFKHITHYKGMSMAAYRLANVYLRNSKQVGYADSTDHYLHLATRWAEQTNDPLLKADINALSSKIQIAKPKSIHNLEQTIAIHQKYSSSGDQIKAMLDLARSYMQLGKIQQAGFLLGQIKNLYTTRHNNEYVTRQQFESIAVEYNKAIGNWKEAYEHEASWHQLEKSGLLADRDGAISRLSVEYETQKREAQLQAQKRELELRDKQATVRNQFLLILSLLSTITILVSFIFYRLYRQNQRTSRRNAELVREQNHRVKNNLQVVSSLLNLYADRLTDPLSRMAVEESQLRVETMALLQRQLYDRKHLAAIDLAEFIPDIVEGVLHSYGFGSINLDLQLASCILSSDQALPVGLITNELTTNACKYAFPASQTPTFSITGRQEGTQLILTVSDNGPGLPTRKIRSDSFGLQLIQLQVEQLRGVANWTSASGTTFNLNFPIHI